MEIVKFALFGIVLVFIIVTLKDKTPEIALFAGIVGGIMLLFMILDYMTTIIDAFRQIFEKTNIDSSLFTAILKIIGIGYIIEFSCGICNDSGNKSIADKISLGGKVAIMVLALPILQNLIDVIVGILP